MSVGSLKQLVAVVVGVTLLVLQAPAAAQPKGPTIRSTRKVVETTTSKTHEQKFTPPQSSHQLLDTDQSRIKELTERVDLRDLTGSTGVAEFTPPTSAVEEFAKEHLSTTSMLEEFAKKYLVEESPVVTTEAEEKPSILEAEVLYIPVAKEEPPAKDPPSKPWLLEDSDSVQSILRGEGPILDTGPTNPEDVPVFMRLRGR